MTRRQGPVSPNSQHRSRSSVRVLTGLFCFALCLPAAWVQGVHITPTRSITANGMTVLFLEQHFLPTVEIHALVKVGSAQDRRTKPLGEPYFKICWMKAPSSDSRQSAEQIDFVGGSLEAHASEDTPPLRHACSRKMRTSGLHTPSRHITPGVPQTGIRACVRTQILGESSVMTTIRATWR